MLSRSVEHQLVAFEFTLFVLEFCSFPTRSLSTVPFPSLHRSGTPYVHYDSDDVGAIHMNGV